MKAEDGNACHTQSHPVLEVEKNEWRINQDRARYTHKMTLNTSSLTALLAVNRKLTFQLQGYSVTPGKARKLQSAPPKYCEQH